MRYAHSRTRALLRNAHDLGVEIEAPAQDPYRHPAETELLGLLADYPRVIETAARRRAPDRVARHLERLADAFFRFHDECDPLPKGDEKPSAVHAARIRLADATGIVLADGLRMLGISAPDHM
ncbi:DALR anticodon-binding domain-containing protein [Streptomyces sp. NBC_00223]|uniref:DALR anticodon-binding domain-containing protein n=1 Tax=Streptomyces sp. NBC_00223 TaxID=2976008 RepID=UPI003FA719C6